MRPLVLLFLSAACTPHAAVCRREFGKTTVQRYLDEQGLSECPGVPEAACRGRIVSPETAACVFERQYQDKVDDFYEWEVSATTTMPWVEDIHVLGLSFVPDLHDGEFVWQLDVGYQDHSGSSGASIEKVRANTGEVLTLTPEGRLEGTEPF